MFRADSLDQGHVATARLACSCVVSEKKLVGIAFIGLKLTQESCSSHALPFFLGKMGTDGRWRCACCRNRISPPSFFESNICWIYVCMCI